ncbi:MAG: rod shape-determining protein RodA [Patescibacteria group bacterium]|nr:rod shape-determining protein RodA [Patescibacteria group bacterium]
MVLLVCLGFLSLFGLFNLFGINQDLFIKQLINITIGFFVFLSVKKLSFHFFRVNAFLFYWFFLATLLITFVIGVEVKGSRRWLDIGFFNFQPSEILKPFFILFLSHLLGQKRMFEIDLVFFGKSFLYFFIPFFIVFFQPDLANSLVYFLIFLVLLFFSRVSKRFLFYLFILLLVALPLFFELLRPYQKTRIISFLNPEVDRLGSSYNLIQSIIAIGSGGFLGKGLGEGTQSRLYFLPESTTDFAFASSVEQFGFFGGLLVIGCYFIIISHALRKARDFYFHRLTEEDEIKFLFCLGTATYLGFQFFVNVGMNMGVFPVAGVALPFISYGGSAIAAMMISLALLP